ncbi:MAG: hypothetical protein NXI01_05200 [Gammaproteobacteria bacterium]|nr:hypothetical protein [Gammaproteobacteria bacterium]
MPEQLYKLLGVSCDADMMHLFDEIEVHWKEKRKRSSKVLGADEQMPFFLDFLYERYGAKLRKLNHKDLNTLSTESFDHQPRLSPRIIVKTANSSTDPELDIGDTIVDAEEGILQILSSENGNLQATRIMPAEALRSHNLEQWQPEPNEPANIYVCDVSDQKIEIAQYELDVSEDPADKTELKNRVVQYQSALELMKKLNSIMQNNPNRLYLGETLGQAGLNSAYISSPIHQMCLNEQKNRQVSRNNLVLKAFKLKSDAAFLSAYETDQIPDAVDLSTWSNADLETLQKQCDDWRPQHSEKILVCGRVPDIKSLDIGDTVITLDGVSQVQRNASGNLQYIKMLSKRQLRHIESIQPYLAKAGEPDIIYSNFSDQRQKTYPVATLLRGALNTALSTQPKSMFIQSPPISHDDTHGQITAALKAQATEELERENRPINGKKKSRVRFWDSKPKPSQTMQERLKSMMQARQNAPPKASSSKKMQGKTTSENPKSRTPQDVQSSIESITEQLNQQESGQYQYTPQSGGTYRIMKQNNVILDANRDTITVYKPFMNNRTVPLSVQAKAIMFLEALGIPPLNGRDTLEITGGPKKLRQAVITLFEEYLAQEKQESSAATPSSSFR